jgi:tetratricopeptide (TPR) repeat protein
MGAAYLRAVELNPNNADALSYYASWLWLQSEVDEAVDYYRQARDVDPMSLVRYADLGYILAFELPGDEAQVVITRILQLFPTAPGYLAAARIAEANGAPEEAIAYAHKARLLRPDDPDIAGQLAEMYARIDDFDRAQMFEPEPGMGQLFWQRRYDELIDLGEELAIDRPGDTGVLLLLAFAYNTSGRFNDALRALDLARMPEAAMSESRRANELHALMVMAGALDAIGDKERADALANYELKRNYKFGAVIGESSRMSHLTVACYLAVLGKDEEALTWLENLNHLEGTIWPPWLKDQACFQKFAGEPRYQAVVTELEDRLAVIRQRLPKTLERQGLVPSQPD